MVEARRTLECRADCGRWTPHKRIDESVSFGFARDGGVAHLASNQVYVCYVIRIPSCAVSLVNTSAPGGASKKRSPVRVRLRGLASRADLNGAHGTVIEAANDEEKSAPTSRA